MPGFNATLALSSFTLDFGDIWRFYFHPLEVPMLSPVQVNP